MIVIYSKYHLQYATCQCYLKPAFTWLKFDQPKTRHDWQCTNIMDIERLCAPSRCFPFTMKHCDVNNHNSRNIT